jgi:hypothetical protein
MTHTIFLPPSCRRGDWWAEIEIGFEQKIESVIQTRPTLNLDSLAL